MAKPRKALWISCVGEKGGAEVYMLNFLAHLDRSRFAPSVAMLRAGPLEVELQKLDVPAFVLNRHRMREVWSVLGAIRRLAEIIREGNFDIVHSNGFRAHTYGGIAAWLAGVPEIWTVFTVEKDGFYTRANLKIPTAQTIAICPRTADYFVAEGCPTSMIWPSVDPQRLKHRTARSVLAAKYGLPEGGRWVSLGARLQRYKGHAYFIRAIAALPKDMANVHGIIMGGTLFGMEPQYPDELKALAAQLGIAERIHFTGFVPDEDVYGFVAASELVVHPALEEDFGLIVAEAQALAKPVLAFASSGPAAIVKDGITGTLIPVGDQEGFSAALKSLLAAPETMQRLGEAGAAHVCRVFDAKETTSQLERVYSACVGTPRTIATTDDHALTAGS